VPEQTPGPDDRTLRESYDSSADANLSPADPTELGPYRILGPIGQGGMGTVYEAEQDSPRRTVALKVIRPGLATDEHLRRFELESLVLGRLQHPGIAQVFEASTARTDAGMQPFFAMELVRGLPRARVRTGDPPARRVDHPGLRRRAPCAPSRCDPP
jgi:serine/threonine protein kinase